MAIVSMLYGAGGASSAEKVSYDNTESGLEADNVQDAIDEVNSNLTYEDITQDFINNISVSVGTLDTSNVKAYKYGKIIFLQARGMNATPISNNGPLLLGTYSGIYKPLVMTRSSGTSGGVATYGSLSTEGVLGIYVTKTRNESGWNSATSATLNFVYLTR